MLVHLLRGQVADGVAHRRLQPAEGEGALQPGAREREGAGVPGESGPLHHRSPRVGEPEHPGDLVEGLADGVVAGARQAACLPVPGELDGVGVAAAHHQRDEGRLQLRVRQPGRIDVAGKVGNPGDGEAAGPGRGLRVGGTHHQAAGQARAAGDGDRVDGLPAALDPGERGVDHGREHLQVGARRQLGDDAAVGSVQRDLGRHVAGEDLPTVAHHRGRRLVARGLDRKKVHGREPSPTPVGPKLTGAGIRRGAAAPCPRCRCPGGCRRTGA